MPIAFHHPARAVALMLLLAGAPFAARAQDTTTVGGGVMTAQDTLTDNLSQSKDHTILVQAIAAAGMNDTLAGSGPYTLFAPTDVAFGKLAPGMVDDLLKPGNMVKLKQLLNYHIVPGRYGSADIEKMAASGNGKAILKTVEGDTLTVEKKGGAWLLEDSSGQAALINQSDVPQSNGVLFVIDTVMQPKA